MSTACPSPSAPIFINLTIQATHPPQVKNRREIYPLAHIPPTLRQSLMRGLRQGQASAFNITRNIRGEARINERAFGLSASVLAEVVQLVREQLDLAAA